jgi:hypothetical protein
MSFTCIVPSRSCSEFEVSGGVVMVERELADLGLLQIFLWNSQLVTLWKSDQYCLPFPPSYSASSPYSSSSSS